jgi:hypothetical protein
MVFHVHTNQRRPNSKGREKITQTLTEAVLENCDTNAFPHRCAKQTRRELVRVDFPTVDSLDNIII